MGVWGNDDDLSGREKWIRFSLVSAYLILVVGFHIATIAISTVIFDRTGNFGGATAFGLLFGWSTTIALVPFVLFKITSKISDERFATILGTNIPLPFPGRRSVFIWSQLACVWFGCSLFSFALSTTAVVRLVPYISFHENFAENIVVRDTQLFKDANAFSWTDAKLNRTSYVMQQTTIPGGTVCDSDCDDFCPCDTNINVFVKYCSAAIVDSEDKILNPSPGIAICFWFPCRDRASYEPGTGPISEHDPIDPDCSALPTQADCDRECAGVDGLTILNGVKVEGTKWNSALSQASIFQSAEAFKYEISFNAIQDLFATIAVPEFELLHGTTVLRTSKGVPVLLNWGDEPIQYFKSGLSITFIVGLLSLLLFCPPSPFCNPLFWPLKYNKWLGLHFVIFGLIYIPLVILMILYAGKFLPG